MPPVKPKPLARSITFWCGVLVMGIVCFAWIDSLRHKSQLRWSPFSVTNIGCGVEVDTASSSADFSIQRTYKSPESIPKANLIGSPQTFILGNGGPLPPDALRGVSEEARRSFASLSRDLSALYVFIPHWLLLLAVALTWSGLLLWRARRIRRAVAGSGP